MSIQLQIISRNKKIFEGSVTSLTLPGTNGSFQILVDHAPMVSTLASGHLYYVQENEKTELVIKQGVVSVHNNTVILLVETDLPYV